MLQWPTSRPLFASVQNFIVDLRAAINRQMAELKPVVQTSDEIQALSLLEAILVFRQMLPKSVNPSIYAKWANIQTKWAPDSQDHLLIALKSMLVDLAAGSSVLPNRPTPSASASFVESQSQGPEQFLQTLKEFCINNEDKLQTIEFEASRITELCLEDVVKVFRSLILKRVNSRLYDNCCKILKSGHHSDQYRRVFLVGAKQLLNHLVTEIPHRFRAPAVHDVSDVGGCNDLWLFDHWGEFEELRAQCVSVVTALKDAYNGRRRHPEATVKGSKPTQVQKVVKNLKSRCSPKTHRTASSTTRLPSGLVPLIKHMDSLSEELDADVQKSLSWSLICFQRNRVYINDCCCFVFYSFYNGSSVTMRLRRHLFLGL